MSHKRTISRYRTIVDPMDRRRTDPVIYYAAIDPGGAGGGAAPGAQPNGAPTPTPQPGGQGNGQGGGFREQFFSNVPDEHWALIEPHISGVNQHMTQLQQRYAPFKGYADQDLQGLAQFSDAFNQDPVGQWIRMAQGMQQAGLLDEQLDLEHLRSLVLDQGLPEPPNARPQPQNGDMPPWAQQLAQRLDQLEGGVNKFQTDHRTQVEDAVLNRQITHITNELKSAGFPEGAVSKEQILASYIAHRGNAGAAVKSFVDVRNALLKGFTKIGEPDPTPTPASNRGNNNDLDLPIGAPQPRQQRQRGGRSKVIPRETQAAAAQFLAKQGIE